MPTEPPKVWRPLLGTALLALVLAACGGGGGFKPGGKLDITNPGKGAYLLPTIEAFYLEFDPAAPIRYLAISQRTQDGLGFEYVGTAEAQTPSGGTGKPSAVFQTIDPEDDLSIYELTETAPDPTASIANAGPVLVTGSLELVDKRGRAGVPLSVKTISITITFADGSEQAVTSAVGIVIRQGAAPSVEPPALLVLTELPVGTDRAVGWDAATNAKGNLVLCGWGLFPGDSTLSRHRALYARFNSTGQALVRITHLTAPDGELDGTARTAIPDGTRVAGASRPTGGALSGVGSPTTFEPGVGSTVDVADPQATFGSHFGSSGDGALVGQANGRPYVMSPAGLITYLKAPSGSDLGGVCRDRSDLGVMVGSCFAGEFERACVWYDQDTPEWLPDPADGTNVSRAKCISRNGNFIGGSFLDGTGVWLPCLWKRDEVNLEWTIETLPAPTSGTWDGDGVWFVTDDGLCFTGVDDPAYESIRPGTDAGYVWRSGMLEPIHLRTIIDDDLGLNSTGYKTVDGVAGGREYDAHVDLCGVGLNRSDEAVMLGLRIPRSKLP